MKRASRYSAIAVLMLGLPSLYGCGEEVRGEAGAGTASARDARQLIAIIDFSASQTEAARRAARAYLEDAVAALGYGDQLILLEMHRLAARDSVRVFARDMPQPRRAGQETSFDLQALNAARHAILETLPIFFDPSIVGRVATTDVHSTLQIASELQRDAAGRKKQILLLSDMLQSTPGIEMDGLRRMPGAEWVRLRKAEGTLPDLSGSCVMVVGADATTAAGQQVRRFWEAYFREAGARLDARDYRLIPPLQEVLSC
ncbi:MAG: hypothetical protein ACRELD_13365 [Longimicrobiales bacterium]